MRRNRNKNTGERGQAMVEVTLLAPWIFFLFIGITDFGFYAYQAICTQSAARVAAVQTAVGGQTQALACTAATAEMNDLPNLMGYSGACSALPLVVSQKTLCGSTTNTGIVTACAGTTPTTPTCADCAQDTAAASSFVTVTYQSGLMVPIPGILTNRMNLTRTAEMRIIVP